MYVGENTSRVVSVEPARRKRSAIFSSKNLWFFDEHSTKHLSADRCFVLSLSKKHSVKLSRNGIIYATVEKTSKKAEKVRAIPAPCC